MQFRQGRSIRLFVYKVLPKDIHNVKATLNLLTYQILNLQGESYKTGIHAGPTIHAFLFSYFSLHFHENA